MHWHIKRCFSGLRPTEAGDKKSPRNTSGHVAFHIQPLNNHQVLCSSLYCRMSSGVKTLNGCHSLPEQRTERNVPTSEWHLDPSWHWALSILWVWTQEMLPESKPTVRLCVLCPLFWDDFWDCLPKWIQLCHLMPFTNRKNKIQMSTLIDTKPSWTMNDQYTLPGSSCLEQLSPFLWVKKLRCELRSKVSIGEIWSVVPLHKIHIGLLTSLPVVPEPFWSKTGDWKNSPVYEDPNLALIVPTWQGSGIYGGPIWGVDAKHAALQGTEDQ